MQAYRLWAAVRTHYLQVVYIGHQAAKGNRRYIAACLKLHLTNQALICVGAMNTR